MEYFHVAEIGIVLHFAPGHRHIGDLDAQVGDIEDDLVAVQIISRRDAETGEQRMIIQRAGFQPECLIRRQKTRLFAAAEAGQPVQETIRVGNGNVKTQ